MNSEYLGFLVKFMAGVLGFGIVTHLLGSYIDNLQMFVAPMDLIFIITLVYLNRNKFSEILSTLEV